jgi:predicted ABC-type sugar transport system permease subunit
MFPTRVVAISLLALAALVAVVVAPSALFADASAPVTIAPFVDAGRADLAGNFNDHQVLPFHLRFVRAECRASGGAVLVFEQRTFPYTDVRYAYVMSGYWPPIAWSGGAGLSAATDDEMAAFLAEGIVPCA